MTDSPYDRGGPDEESPLELFWDSLYEKFPWLADLVDSDPESWPTDLIQKEIEKLISYVIAEAHRQGMNDSSELADQQEMSFLLERERWK